MDYLDLDQNLYSSCLYFGFVFAFLSFFIGLYYVIVKIFDPNITPGLSSTILIITFFVRIAIIGFKLIGEYIILIYDEVKLITSKYIIDKINKF